MGNTPNIRFKGFTDDWEQRKLGEICQRVIRKNKNNESDLPLTIASQYGLIDQRDFFNKVVAAKDMSNYYLLRKGEFAYNKSYSNGFEYGSIKRLNAYEQGCLSTLYICFEITSDEVDSDYLECFFDTLKWYGDLSMICAEGARNHGLLNVDIKAFFADINVSTPTNLKEQRKIATYLNNLDHLITLHQRKCDETKKLKKFMLQKMFPKKDANKPEIRFAGFTDDWEQRKWIDTVDISTEMVDPTTGEYDDMPHIAPGNIEPFTGRILDNVKTVKEEQLISGKFRFRPNDVVYGKINPQLGKYFYASIDGLTSADAYVFNGKNGITQKFLYSVLQTKDFFKYSISVSKRSGMPKINRDELNAYSFCVPKEEEQEKIGDFLLGIDNLITLHQRKCDELKEFKKYMLQNMFPQKG
mgnify:CR=1 FL=1